MSGIPGILDTAIPGTLQYLKSKILHYCNTWDRNTAILGILSIIMLGKLNTAIHRKINTAILQYLGYKILRNWLALHHQPVVMYFLATVEHTLVWRLCSTLGCNSSK